VTSSERRQAILEALCERRHDKVENLAYEFHVSERTIRNDVLELSLSYPVYTVSGRYHSGVYIADDYYLGKQYLTEEQLELLLSLKSQVGDDQRRILDSIVKKFGKVKKEDRC
jgi:predicted DNA-binding transcriptional regulator YafY